MYNVITDYLSSYTILLLYLTKKMFSVKCPYLMRALTVCTSCIIVLFNALRYVSDVTSWRLMCRERL